MSGEPHLGQIDHPSAWTSAEIGGREGLTHRLSAEQVDAIGALLARVRDRPVQEITQQDFSAPAVDDLMRAARHEVMHGHGAIILSGLDPDRYDVEDFARLYWGLGTHLGTGVIQSGRGDWVGYVRREEGGAARGYTTDLELRSHTDFHEILSLASIVPAEQGGESGIVSALAVHNVIARERPDLLAALYAGAIQDFDVEAQGAGEQVPFFCAVDGVVSCFYSRVFMRGGPLIAGEISPELAEALAFFDAVASRPEIRADFPLQAGEMLFWHNFQMLHSRRSFKDSADRKRLLLRLWLNVPDGRPLAAPIRRLTRRMDVQHERLARAA